MLQHTDPPTELADFWNEVLGPADHPGAEERR